MDAYEIIEKIRTAEKKTPVRVTLTVKAPCTFSGVEDFCGGSGLHILYGDWEVLRPQLEANRERIAALHVENEARNSALPMLDLKTLHARIEPGAILREGVTVGDNAVVMMGAILNIGAVVGEGSMIDMGAVLGGRAIVGNRCHIGAGTVLAGVVEPASATPVVIEDDVMIGANAVVIEGVRVGRGAVVGAGAIVIKDVPAGAVVVGNPARSIKMKDEKTEAKTALIVALRTLD